MVEHYMGLVGLVVMMFLAWLLSENKQKMDFRVIFGGLFLQFFLAIIILKTEAGSAVFVYAKDAFNAVINLSDQGSAFIFGENFREHFFAFKVLPTIIFVSSLSYLFFYWGILQRVVQVMSWSMSRVMNISGVESMVTAANVFCGQTEAPLFVQPYIKGMTRSEIMTMMTSGMATVAGGVLAAYVGFGISAGHLLAGSLMSAPAAILIARIIVPETEQSLSRGKTEFKLQINEVNSFDAACKGASDGLMLALNVAAMLIAFIALVAFFNLVLAKVLGIFGFSLTIEEVLGTIFQPFAFVMGVSWEESFKVGRLLGEKMVINEFIAYLHLSELMKNHEISERAATIATYALCGFANFSSVAIQIGGIGSLSPSRKQDFAKYAFKAMLGGTLAAFMTACIASLLI